MAEARHVFMAWHREGLAATLATPRNPVDDAGQALQPPVAGQPDPSEGLRSRVTLTARALVNGEAPAAAAATSLRLLGPGEVTGLDQRAVVGTEPPDGSAGFVPGFFPAVELVPAGLPWLFTPSSPSRDGKRLLPWLALLVVEDREGVSLRPGEPLSVLEIATHAAWELPDPAQAWAWAHAHTVEVASPAGTAAPKRRAVARLMCPRRLLPRVPYIAALVPLFEVGRKAGLGLPVDNAPGGADDDLRLAWSPSAESALLPVYYSWRFHTGDAGTFESLARSLEKRPSSAGGTRTVAVGPGEVGFGLPAAGPGGVLPFGGALSGGRPPAPVDAAFRDRLRGDVLTAAPGSPAVFRPPIYGGHHAQSPESPCATRLGRPGYTGPDRPWLEELNLDPTLRFAAGLGTRAVQEQQEQLVAAAWEQVGEVQRANQLLRQAQLAREASGSCFRRHLVPLAPAAGLLVSAPVHARVPSGSGTLAGCLAERPALASAFRPTFRRVARLRGPLARRAGSSAGLTARLVERLNRGGLPTEPETPAGAALLPVDVGSLQAGIGDGWPVGLREHLRGLLPEGPRPRPVEPLPLARLFEDVLRHVDPEIAVARRILWRLDLGSREVGDPLDEVMAAPELPAPMYRALADLSPDDLLPGAADVPRNGMSALVPDRRFIEAFLVGVNHELGRELLWRGFPTDQRGSPCRQFWDTAGHVPPLVDPADIEAHRDIPPIHRWRASLGANTTPGSGAGMTVLVLRGELLARYPHTAVYAAEAVMERGSRCFPRTGAVERHPAFRGRLGDDLVFLGFGLSPQAMVGQAGHPGWYFVLQEPPGEPRFGLDDGPGDPASDWLDLTWAHVGWKTGGKAGAEHVDLAVPLVGFTEPPGRTWGLQSNAADTAAITRRPPFRVAVHASDLLP